MKNLCLLLFLCSTIVYSQNESDPCGYNLLTKSPIKSSTSGWGYPYDTLIKDIKYWKQNKYIKIDSIGTSVLGRTIWLLKISDTNIKNPISIHLHARTHPAEVQSSFLINEIIKNLTNSSIIGNNLLKKYVFYIIPMYNPDGVELGYDRTNANYVDLESDWNSSILEPETKILKKHFEQRMNSSSPLKIALNLHSSYNCLRFFVFHDAFGTSIKFSNDQKNFISSIQQYFPLGIQNWDYFITWKTSTPTQYPESWFWINYQDQVLALTYEDMNCPQAGQYQQTSNAILNGIYKYLNDSSLSNPNLVSEKKNISCVYPTILNYGEALFINKTILNSCDLNSTITIISTDGKIVLSNPINQNTECITTQLKKGFYIVKIKNQNQILSTKIIIK